MLGVQILGLLFAAGLLYVTYVQYRKKHFTINEYLFWSSFSAILAILSIYPGAIAPLVEPLAFTRVMDMLIVLGFIFVITALYYVYLVSRRVDRRVERLVTEIALRKK